MHKENLLNQALQRSSRTTKKSPSINFHFKRDCPIISCYTATFPLGPPLKGRSVHWYRCGAEGARGGEGKEHNTWPFQWSPLVHLDYGEERGKQSVGRKEEEGLWAWLRTIVSLCSANTKCIILSSRSQLTAGTKNNITLAAVERSTLLVQMHVYYTIRMCWRINQDFQLKAKCVLYLKIRTIEIIETLKIWKQRQRSIFIAATLSSYLINVSDSRQKNGTILQIPQRCYHYFFIVFFLISSWEKSNRI